MKIFACYNFDLLCLSQLFFFDVADVAPVRGSGLPSTLAGAHRLESEALGLAPWVLELVSLAIAGAMRPTTLLGDRKMQVSCHPN